MTTPPTSNDLSRAADPKTPASELFALAGLHTPEILRRLGSNPATPLALLLRLATWVPGEVLANPAWELYLLERGAQIFDGIDYPAAVSLLTRPESATFIELVADSAVEVIQMVAARQSALSPRSMEVLAGSSYGSILRNLARRADLIAGAAHRLSQHENERIRSVLAANPALPPELQHALARDHSERVRQSLGRNPGAVPSVLLPLLDDPDKFVREVAAEHPHLPQEALLRCVDHRDVNIRGAVAMNPSLPLSWLRKLASDASAKVRAEVAFLPRIPADWVLELATDPDAEVRCAIAKNCATSPEILRALVLDSDDEVRAEVASNPNTPIDVLVALARAEDPFLFALLANPSLPREQAMRLCRLLLDRGSLEMNELVCLMDSPVLPGEIVEELSPRLDWKGNWSLPTSTPVALMTKLASGPEDARSAVAFCRATPDDLLEKLAWDRAPLVALTARNALRSRGKPDP